MEKELLKKLIVLVIVFYSILFFWILPVSSAESDSEETKKIDIMTTPEKVLFDLRNLKPGDWSTRKIVVTNSGLEDFHYIVSGKKKTGSVKLYEALELTINDSSGEIFNGKMSDFKKLDSRKLTRGKNDKLEFTVRFPEELGNEYQGLLTEVEFKFYAEGTLGGLLPVDGPKLPATASGYYNLLLIGIVFLVGGVLFYISRNKLKLKKNNNDLD